MLNIFQPFVILISEGAQPTIQAVNMEHPIVTLSPVEAAVATKLVVAPMLHPTPPK